MHWFKLSQNPVGKVALCLAVSRYVFAATLCCRHSYAFRLLERLITVRDPFSLRRAIVLQEN